MKQAAVIGMPINHSLSPTLHGFWLKKYAISGSYDAIAIKPQDLKEFVLEQAPKRLVGFNVTIPHKEAIMSHLANVSEAAKLIGAVNTVYLKDGCFFGDNSDYIGFSQNIESHLDNKRKVALVIGAGGAARAVIFALFTLGFQKIIVMNRTLQSAKLLADEFSKKLNIEILAMSLSDNSAYDESLDIIVNTTSMGMQLSSPFIYNFANVNKSCLVTDIVYNPLKTPLLTNAEDMGFTTVDGIGMLLHQARLGFKHWFGVDPIVDDELTNCVLQRLNK